MPFLVRIPNNESVVLDNVTINYNEMGWLFNFQKRFGNWAAKPLSIRRRAGRYASAATQRRQKDFVDSDINSIDQATSARENKRLDADTRQ